MTEPLADRPHVPGYGIPTTLTGTLPWSWAVERLERALTYTLATTGADGAPHVIPIWGAWVDGHWYVEGGPTRWQRNLRENPQMAIQIDNDHEVVIVEGTATELVAPQSPLAEAILAGYAKYKAAESYEANAENWTEGGLWQLTPVKAFAWSSFPADMTRFRFAV
jgi:nitroimidazol reductase NimA-like FMN-containing flavoprotein (pyridoxamine 5'-phosphate oxidase superfamily)